MSSSQPGVTFISHLTRVPDLSPTTLNRKTNLKWQSYHAIVKHSFLLFAMYSRLKVAAACNNCRRRKTKCDAQSPSAFLFCSCSGTSLTLKYPVCQPCRNRGEIACTYGRDLAADQRRLSKSRNRPDSGRMAETSPRHRSVPTSLGMNNHDNLVEDRIFTERSN